MPTLSIAEDILPLGQFKAHASRLLHGIRASNRPLVITQNGRPAAVVLSPAEFDRLSAQARFISAVQEGLEDEREGRMVDDAELDTLLTEQDTPTQ